MSMRRVNWKPQPKGILSPEDHRAQSAAMAAADMPAEVRFWRSPAPRPPVLEIAEPVVVAQPQAGPEPLVQAPQPALDPSRVRYWRTPRHLLREVWGGGEPAQDETVALVDAAEAEQLDQELFEDIAFEAAEPAESRETPGEPLTPFAFLSHDAFWEFVPEAERLDEDEEPPAILAEAPRPIAAALPVIASAAPKPAPAEPKPVLGWTQSYRLDLSFGTPKLSMPAPEPAVPVEEPPPPAPREVDRIAEPPRLKRRVIEASRPLPEGFQLPPIEILAEPPQTQVAIPTEVLQQNSGLLEGVLEDFNVRGEVVQACPGPVVTLYELEPAPGTKSSRVISLADDIARSMSAVSARVAVVQGKNAIGIELPNAKRETVFLRELLASQDFESTKHKLALCLGKTIGGEPVIADLARMPHLLVAGTTGSGKSVAINTMILSILYRLKPEQCRLIMVDPKMLELSVYDGIPHLLTPVVTDPKKAVVALKWAVREMEERYKKMSKLGVRNIDGFNVRVGEAKAAGEVITRTVQTGFDRHSGEAIYEEEVMDLEPLPYIVVIVDEMADLMMVAGKEIEGTIQRLAQMARAAGIHVVLATQRPSVDVITGTIKANFPTRISFQVTSKIDSRTILGEMGAEQLLGQGDMLYMAGGGRITRVHGPFVSDAEVEKVVAHLKTQGRPDYLDAVTAEEEAGAGEEEDGAVFDKGALAGAESEDPYEQAVQVVLRDKKASTSYIQRRLQIGYNRAASIMERMENEGIVGPANHAGKREILVESVGG
jgi:S-DNA-T family DNA segregation ATPase FtsK/SpoIIIE